MPSFAANLSMTSIGRSSFVRMAAATILIAASLGLAGCGSRPGYGITDSFEIADEPDQAIVVLGTLLSHPPHQVETWFDTLDDGLYVRWVLIDPPTGSVIRNRSFMAANREDCDRPELYTVTVPCEPDFQNPQFFVFAVEPGDYALSSVREADPEKPTTYFFSAEPSILSVDVSDVIAEDSSPWFHVNAGDVVYIGNYVFDVEDEMERLVAIERTDDLAREALALYPGIDAELVYLPVKAKEVVVPPL